jgi:hypothetical protein
MAEKFIDYDIGNPCWVINRVTTRVAKAWVRGITSDGRGWLVFNLGGHSYPNPFPTSISEVYWSYYAACKALKKIRKEGK